MSDKVLIHKAYNPVENLRLTHIKKQRNPTKILNCIVWAVSAGGILLVMAKYASHTNLPAKDNVKS